MEQKPVAEILKEIEMQTDYRFSYNPELLKNVPPLSLQMQDESIERVLKIIFDKTDIQFIIRAKHIILKRKPKQIIISGFIYDRESHESLISANIIDLVTGQGAVSNSFGFYSISLPPGNITLRPSYVGYTAEAYSFTTTQDTVIQFFSATLLTPE